MALPGKVLALTPTDRFKKHQQLHEGSEEYRLLSAALVQSGDVEEYHEPTARLASAPSRAPSLIYDLPVGCPTCQAALTARHYHCLVNSSRFMVWIEGLCTGCMETKTVIWDPLPEEEGRAKARAEAAATVQAWADELLQSVQAGGAGDE
jgi:hypothetical protein